MLFCFVSSLVSLFFILFQIFGDSFSAELAPDFFINQNIVAAFSLLALFVSLHCYKASLSKLFLFPVLLNSLSLLYARSFGGWIAAGAAFIYLYKTNKKIILAGTGSIAVLLLLYKTFYPGWVTQRIHWWSASFQILVHSPFFGSGPGTFSKFFTFFMEPGLKSPYAHNFFLQTASEWGIPATVLFLLFIFNRIKAAHQNFLTAGLVALLVQNVYDYSMNIPGFFIYFWIFLGIASKEEKFSDLQLKPWAWKVWFIAMALLLLSGWSFGIKPLLSFSETLQAQKAFEKSNLNEAEKHIRRAVALDPLPSKTWSDLSKLLWMQYQMNKKNVLLLDEAIRCQKEAFLRDPFSNEFVALLKNDKKR